MEKFMSFMDKYIVPVAAKVGAQRHLVAVRDAFIAMIPITMVGALGTLINNLPLEAYKNLMASIFGENWTMFGGDLWWGAIGTMAVFLVIGVAYFLAKSYESDGLQAGLIALSIFFIMAPQIGKIVPEGGTSAVEGWGMIQQTYLGTAAIFNIGEPLIFGLPIVLNPIFMIPFVLAPVVCSAVSYLAIDFGLVAPVILPKIPWVTPPILGGAMATGDWTGGALALFNLILSILIYIPFVIASEKMEAKKLTKIDN
ncbi:MULTISPECIES: hypothetical protein [unclassified Clostridioides]|uniref:hypothetical protein n=1 Tax=unclassified Clostridioides TaxID=2635829 RepID=UPI001D11B6B6|nr:PTS sugar transporter subunit IIC [Clostridioides sp. ES-S-0048-02]UDN61309.1 PTS sugar transporter subunit IIC [Clostridioides sp. ES-W-0016-02]